MAQLNFDARQVEPAKPLEAIPTGWYHGKIVNSEVKPTKAQDGSYLELAIEIVGGQFNGRKVFDRLNLDNPNPVAKEIAYKTLSAICHACGVFQVQDSAQLHGIVMSVRVVQKAARTDTDGTTYDASNEVKGYKVAEGAPAAAATPTQAPVAGGSGPGFGGAPTGFSAPSPSPSPASGPWGAGPAQPPPAAAPAAPAGPRMNPPPPYQEGDVVAQPGQQAYQLRGGQWIPYTAPAAAPPAPPPPPAYAPPPPSAAPAPAAAPPWAGAPAGPPAGGPPPAPAAPPPPAAGQPSAPPWAR